MLKLPPLNALRVFETAARHQSFKSAADELCVTQGAVSRQILNLEEFLGTKLFVRRHRQITLTPDGAAYLETIREALIRISSATSRLAAGPAHRTLKIKLPPTCAIWWLVPRLVRFHMLHPEITVQVTTSHEPVAFDHEDVDVAVHYGSSATDDVVRDRLFGEVLIPVCSEGLSETAAHLCEPGVVADQSLLHSIRRPTDWHRWFEVAGISKPKSDKRIVFENSALTYQGAIDGLGIALAQLVFVADALPSRRLVVPLDICVENEAAYFLAFPPYKERLPEVAAFRSWVGKEAAATRRADPRL